jgi:hypothetical protein
VLWADPAALGYRQSLETDLRNRISGTESQEQRENDVEQSHHDVGAMIQLSPDQCRRAALAVCSRALDSADAQMLLEALGLRQALTVISIPA